MITVTSCAPAFPTGVVAVKDVALMKLATTIAPPIVTIAPETKSLPAIVMRVPPAVLPEFGLTDVIIGAGAPIART